MDYNESELEQEKNSLLELEHLILSFHNWQLYCPLIYLPFAEMFRRRNHQRGL